VKVWIVSLVKRGFIEEPEIFYNASGAEKRKQKLLSDFNPDYDEIEVFQKRIRANVPKKRRIGA
jgi:hypothetical protein